MVKRDIPVIYISAKADRALTIRLISQHIAEIFNSSVYCQQIELILTTDDSEMDNLLSQVFQLPELPDGCSSFIADGSFASILFDDALGEFSEFESVDSPKSETVRPATATLEPANQVSSEYAAAKCSVNLDFRNKLGTTTYGRLSRGLRSGFAGEFFVWTVSKLAADFRFSSS